jgi:phosphotransferase system enzyme I (PtsP)
MLLSWRQIVREVNAAASLQDALALLVHRVKDALPIDVCSVYLTDLKNDQYVLIASEGLNPASIGWVRVGLREGLLGLVGERRELVVMTDVAADRRYRLSAETGENRYGSFLGMPLIHYQQVLGVLVAWKQTHRQFDKDEVTFFVTIAAPLAKAIHGAAAVDEVSRMLSGEMQENAFIQGIQAARGVAIGTATLLDPLAKLESIPDREAQDVVAEETAFRAAIADLQRDLESSKERLAPILTKDVCGLFDVYVMLLGNDGLVSDTVERIHAGSWALGAWRDSIAKHARAFEQMEDPYLRARAIDIHEIGQRILVRLRSEVREPRQFPERCILVGENLGITEIAAVPAGRLAGIVCMRGSALSHTAVLARALGIPAVVSLVSLPAGRLDGCE